MTAAAPPRRAVRLPGVRRPGRPPTGPKRGRGQPTKFSPEVAALVLAKVALLVPLDDCAGCAGISGSTLCNWLARGEADAAEGKRTALADFAVALLKARAGARVELWEKMIGWVKSTKDARMALRILEAIAPELYAPPLPARARGEEPLPPMLPTGGPAAPRIFLPAELEEDDAPEDAPVGDGEPDA